MMNPVVTFVAFVFGSRLFALFAFYPIAAAIYLPFDKSLTHLPLLLGCYSFFQSFFQLVWAGLSQSLGRLPMIRIGLGMFLFASLLAFFAPNLEVLLIARSLQGACAIGATTQALLADYIADLKELQSAYYQIGIAIVLSFMLSFIVSPLFQPASLFFILLSATAAVSIVASYYLPKAPQSTLTLSKTISWKKPSKEITATLAVNFTVHFLQALAIGSYQIIARPGTYEITSLFLIALLLCFKPLKERRLSLSFSIAQKATFFLIAIILGWTVVSFTQIKLLLALLCGGTFVLLLLLEASLPAQLRQSALDDYPLWIGVYTTLQSLAIGIGSLCLYYVHYHAALAITFAVILSILFLGLRTLKDSTQVAGA